jgi:hypothetical protein
LLTIWLKVICKGAGLLSEWKHVTLFSIPTLTKLGSKEMEIMLLHMVQIKLVKGAYSLYFSQNFTPELYNDYMAQAAFMAKPYIKEGWHLVHAMIIDYNN